MLFRKQSAIIIINKQTNLLLKNDTGSSLEKSTLAPLLFSKIVKTPARVYSDTPAPVHLWPTLSCRAEVGPEPDYQTRLQQDSAFFFRT